MCKTIIRDQKHVTLNNHIIIKKGLEQHRSFCSIAIQPGKDPFTISKE